MHHFVSQLISVLVAGSVLLAFGGFVWVLWRVQKQHEALLVSLEEAATKRGWELTLDGDPECTYRLEGTWSDGVRWIVEGMRDEAAIEGTRIRLATPAGWKGALIFAPSYQEAWVFSPELPVMASALDAALGQVVDAKDFAVLSDVSPRLERWFVVVSDQQEGWKEQLDIAGLEEALLPWLQRLSPEQLPLLAVTPHEATVRWIAPILDAETITQVLTLARQWYVLLEQEPS